MRCDARWERVEECAWETAPVWRARERSTGREAIVKLLDYRELIVAERERTPLEQRFSPIRGRFAGALAAWRQIAHPGVASLYEGSDDGETLWVAIAPQAGAPIGAAKCTIAEARLLGIALYEALAAVHDAGATHGAIGRDDVWLASDRKRIVLVDVAARTAMHAMIAMANETRAGGLRTSQLRKLLTQPIDRLNTAPPTAAGDVYSAAVLIAQLALGEAPRAPSLPEVIAYVTNVPELVARVPDPALARTLALAITTDAATRPTAAALAAALRAIA